MNDSGLRSKGIVKRILIGLSSGLCSACIIVVVEAIAGASATSEDCVRAVNAGASNARTVCAAVVERLRAIGPLQWQQFRSRIVARFSSIELEPRRLTVAFSFGSSSAHKPETFFGRAASIHCLLR